MTLQNDVSALKHNCNIMILSIKYVVGEGQDQFYLDPEMDSARLVSCPPHPRIRGYLKHAHSIN